MARRRSINVANRLASIREERGLRAIYVAGKIGITAGTLSSWETLGGQLPSFTRLASLANFYGLTFEQIEEAITNAQA